ncbi:MAG: dihydroorotate dehydrogenase electron transfer subunit [Fibrobacterota bacterium]
MTRSSDLVRNSYCYKVQKLHDWITYMLQFDAKVLKNVKIADSFYYLEMTWDHDTPVVPGHFLTLRITDDTTPLLRRPFAFSGFDPASSTCSIIYQKRGRGTELLTSKLPGDTINLIGPLGNPFPNPSDGSKPILVAGGIGVGPMLFLASEYMQKQLPFSFIFGCRTKSFIPDLDTFRVINPVICTDDGSAGFKGTTADYLKTIEKSIQRTDTVYCCGPHPMLKACHELALRTGSSCQVSVEQIMACGVGACMGCVVKTVAEPGYARACKEGPVFNSKDLVW